MPPRRREYGVAPRIAKKLGLLGCFFDGVCEEAIAPGAGLVFAEVAGACSWVPGAVLGACEIAGDDEVQGADRVP